MDTLSNTASAVSRAIFGETNAAPSEEPVSGKLGDTTKGEPYDAGNSADSTNTEKTNPETNTTTNTNTNTNTTDLPTREKADTSNMSSINPTTASDAPGNTASTNPIKPEHEHDKTGVTDLPHPSSAFTSDKPSSSNEPTGTGPEPSVSADPTSGAQNTSKQQGADRPEETPDTNRIQEAKKEAEEAQGVDVSGPGPVSLEERAKTGGGAATTSGGGGDDDGPQSESHGEGTGEKYVKSSGMKSEGGDFDAANPGAGKEADRLLGEKGIHHTTEPGKSTEESVSSEDTSANKKPSLKEKIKAKLHKH